VRVNPEGSVLPHIEDSKSVSEMSKRLDHRRVLFNSILKNVELFVENMKFPKILKILAQIYI